MKRSTAITVLAVVAAVTAVPGAALAHGGDGTAGGRALMPGDTVTTQRVAGHTRRVETHGDPIGAFRTGPHQGRAVYPGPAGAEYTARGSGPVLTSTPAAACGGVPNTADDTANAFNAPPLVKVIYAYPSDRSSRFGTYAPVIQAGVRAASDAVFAEAGDKSIRFDLGTSQGQACVDIQTIALPDTQAAYSGSFSFFPIVSDVIDALGGPGALGTRNFLVYADWMGPPGFGGQADSLPDDAYAGSAHNAGKLFALIYGSGGTDFLGSGGSYPSGFTSYEHMLTVAHEISHTLGAVQDSAPNSSGLSHCVDEWDLMCYSDGGYPLLSPPPCNTLPYSASNEAWDCGRNDYMNPSPAPVSYLGTHWNIYRSDFLCTFSTCGPQDSQAPDTKIYYFGANGPTRDPSPDFNFGAIGEPAAHFICSMDDQADLCSSPYTSPPLPDGEHRFEVRAVDSSFNIDQSPATSAFTVDTVRPDTTVKGRRRTRDRTPRFALGSNEPSARFQCRLDRGRWRRCSSPYTAKKLSPGGHSLKVRAIDLVGLIDPAPAKLRFKVIG